MVYYKSKFAIELSFSLSIPQPVRFQLQPHLVRSFPTWGRNGATAVSSGSNTWRPDSPAVFLRPRRTIRRIYPSTFRHPIRCVILSCDPRKMINTMRRERGVVSRDPPLPPEEFLPLWLSLWNDFWISAKEYTISDISNRFPASDPMYSRRRSVEDRDDLDCKDQWVEILLYWIWKNFSIVIELVELFLKSRFTICCTYFNFYQLLCACFK